MTSKFPILVPFATFQFRIAPPLLVGSLTRGTPLTVVPIHAGTVHTEESWHKSVADGGLGRCRVLAEVVGGPGRGAGGSVDYIRNDPDGGRMRLDSRVVVTDDEGNVCDLVHDDGCLLQIHYTGIITITPEVAAILGGNAASKSTTFGNSFINVSFESGCERFQELERGVFVGSGRFVIDERGLTSEYKVSQVAAIADETTKVGGTSSSVGGTSNSAGA